MSSDFPLPRFALAISEYRDADGMPHYGVKSKTFGIPRESIIAVVRSWLKLNEDEYYQDFLRKQ